jgi:hypothetical protein
MSQEFRGFVVKINTKNGTGKTGKPWTLYSIKLESEDGTELKDWLSIGFDRPKFKEGDYVKLTAAPNKNGYMQVDANSVLVSKNPPARGGSKGEVSGASASTGSSSRGNYSKGGVDWNSAVARSIELVDLLIKHDALNLSAAKGASGIEKRRTEIEAIVDKYTVKLYNDVMSLRLLETVQDPGVPDTAADGPLPAADDVSPEKEDDSDF